MYWEITNKFKIFLINGKQLNPNGWRVYAKRINTGHFNSRKEAVKWFNNWGR